MHINSEHTISLTNIPCSQVLRVLKTHSMLENFNLYCSKLKQGHKSDLLDKHISRVEKLDEKNVNRRVREKPTQTHIPLTLTYNCFCLNISNK